MFALAVARFAGQFATFAMQTVPHVLSFGRGNVAALSLPPRPLGEMA